MTPEMERSYRRNFGLPPAHPVAIARRILADAYLVSGYDSDESRLIVWGTPHKHGLPLYQQVGLLMRCPWLDGIAVQAGVSKTKLVTEWVNLLSLEQPQVRHAIEKIIIKELDRALSRHPDVTYVALSRNMLEWTRRLAGDNRRLAYYYFRVLQRVQAYQREGYLVFRSSWLRAAGKDPRAIPGCSGHYTELKTFLNTYVLERTAGHWAGKRAATYRLRIPIEVGDVDQRRAGELLGLRLGEDDIPRGHRSPSEDLVEGPCDHSTAADDQGPLFPNWREAQ